MVAAGNSGTDELQYPAAYPEAIAVAATNAGGVLTDFSSYGATDVATIEPTAPLLDNTPYRIVVRGVQWDGGTLAPYTYAAWIEDRGGKVSPVATTQLLGMKTGISTTSTLINYGGTITLRGSTLRIDNKPYAGLPTNLHVRPKNSSKFTLLAALKTSSTGTVSFTDKPLVSSVFMMTFPGNADLMGTRTPDITVQVAPSIGRPAARGQIAYRIWFPGDADHAQAFSANKIVTVG